MAFKKYEPRQGGARVNPLRESRFPLCWLGTSSSGIPGTLTFNQAALELFGEDTEALEIMWDGEDRRFAFIPAPVNSRDGLKLSQAKNDPNDIRRVGTTGLVSHFPELANLGGRVWRILVEPGAEYFVSRFASLKEEMATE